MGEQVRIAPVLHHAHIRLLYTGMMLWLLRLLRLVLGNGVLPPLMLLLLVVTAPPAAPAIPPVVWGLT